MVSQGLETFLNYLRETEQQLHIAEQAEQEASDATQDILHRIELCDLQEGEADMLAYKLRDVRRRRREAKDLEDQIDPVMVWVDNHRPEIKELERLLGEVRKRERRAQDRIYTPRTNILEDAHE